MMKVVCRYNKYGYCIYGDKCHFRHVNVICVNDKCSVFECEKRHPVVCKYYINFKKCKFSNCAYSHDIKTDVNENDDRIKKMEKKLIERRKLMIKE